MEMVLLTMLRVPKPLKRSAVIANLTRIVNQLSYTITNSRKKSRAVIEGLEGVRGFD